jgi:hypothetical protein
MPQYSSRSVIDVAVLRLSQVIVLSKVLAHEVNIGYHSVGCGVLISFNGRKVANLRALAKAIDDVSSTNDFEAQLCIYDLKVTAGCGWTTGDGQMRRALGLCAAARPRRYGSDHARYRYVQRFRAEHFRAAHNCQPVLERRYGP